MLKKNKSVIFKHIIAIILSIIVMILNFHYNKVLVHTVQDYNIRMKMIPIFSIGYILGLYIFIIIYYLFFKLMVGKEVSLKEICNKFIVEYSASEVLMTLIYLPLLYFTDNKLILSISEIVAVCIFCYFVNRFCNQKNVSNIKKYIILIFTIILLVSW